MRKTLHSAFQWHVIERVHDIDILRIRLQTDDNEARDAERLEELFALLVDFGGDHRRI